MADGIEVVNGRVDLKKYGMKFWITIMIYEIMPIYIRHGRRIYSMD